MDAAWIQRGIEEVHSHRIAEFYFSLVPEGVPQDDPDFSLVPEGDPPPEDGPPQEDGSPPPAAPAETPWTQDASAVAEPVSPHTLPLDATPVGSKTPSDLPPLGATQVVLLGAPAGAPLRPTQAAAPQELVAVAATEAAEAAKRLAVTAFVSPSQLAEEGDLG